MHRIKLDIPNYDKQMAVFLNEVVDGFIALDPLLSQIPSVSTRHSGPTRNLTTPEVLDQPMEESQHILTIRFDDIRQSNIEEFTRMISELVNWNKRIMVESLLRNITAVTDTTGNTVNAEDKPFSFDMLCDVIEKLPIEFDEDGKPLMPTMFMDSNTFKAIQQTKPTPEQEIRWRKIIAQKKAEYYAAQRSRRLS